MQTFPRLEQFQNRADEDHLHPNLAQPIDDIDNLNHVALEEKCTLYGIDDNSHRPGRANQNNQDLGQAIPLLYFNTFYDDASVVILYPSLL